MVKTVIVCGYCGHHALDRQKLRIHTNAKHKKAKVLEADPDDELARPGPQATQKELMAFRQAITKARKDRNKTEETKRLEERRSRFVARLVYKNIFGDEVR